MNQDMPTDTATTDTPMITHDFLLMLLQLIHQRLYKICINSHTNDNYEIISTGSTED